MGDSEAIRANQVAMIDRLDRIITLMNELCGYENSALHILEEVHKKKSAAPTPQDGPENSAQQQKAEIAAYIDKYLEDINNPTTYREVSDFIKGLRQLSAI